MANNRMFIKCTVCNEKKMIAKYYPSSGWYFDCLPAEGDTVKICSRMHLLEQLERIYDNGLEYNIDNFNNWINEHSHTNLSDTGATNFVLEFESKEK